MKLLELRDYSVLADVQASVADYLTSYGLQTSPLQPQLLTTFSILPAIIY
jgi:hypothetical protein